MKVFVTGGSGFIGSAVVSDLIKAGHDVLALLRSDASRDSLQSQGAEIIWGDLDNLDSLRNGVSQSDAVVHCAFGSDFSKLLESSAQDKRAIEAMGKELAGSDRPIIITSVVMMGKQSPEPLAREDVFDRSRPNPLRLTEIAGAEIADRGVNVSIVRLPQVHNRIKQGIPGMMRMIAQQKGVSAYIGEGSNRWSAGHLLDVTQLYRLVLESKRSGGVYHAVGEEGISLRRIAELIGEKLQIPVVSLSAENATDHFGPLAMLVGMDLAASSASTQELLKWHPKGPGLLDDLAS